QLRDTGDAGQDLFSIAEHLNEAADLIESPQDRLALAVLNLKAARQARAASAWNAAARHTRMARSQLPADAWEQHYELTAPIFVLSVECEILDSQFDAAEQLADQALQRLQSAIDKARVCFLLLNSNIVRGRRDYALKMGVEGLGHCGIPLPDLAHMADEMQADQQTIAERLGQRPLAECMA